MSIYIYLCASLLHCLVSHGYNSSLLIKLPAKLPGNSLINESGTLNQDIRRRSSVRGLRHAPKPQLLSTATDYITLSTLSQYCQLRLAPCDNQSSIGCGRERERICVELRGLWTRTCHICKFDIVLWCSFSGSVR